MGINLKDFSWDEITGKWRTEQTCKKGRNKSEMADGKCCAYHHWQLWGEKFEPQGHITTTPATEAFIKANRKKRLNGDGEEVITTARGRRRRARLDAAKGR